MNRLTHSDFLPDAPPVPFGGRRSLLGTILDDPDLPAIMVTTTDALSLTRLADVRRSEEDRAVAFLAHELARAAVVPPAEIHAQTMTMRSVARFRLNDNGATCEAMLVYPGEASLSDGKLSVLAPVGTALLGLSRGQLMPYVAAEGRVKTLTLLDVVFQPEACGLDWR
ncbi:MAG TPA: GreA/GreB family elongation factor [Stellaceae bacterium]|nr:GreA/GreB family elongation factor [Stellaceae bacterium]